jgi:serine/threonine protein kinase
VQGSGPFAPRMLGRYALYEKIASGGMASVHLGRLLGPVGFARTVAIKRMHPQFAEDPEFVSMFLDEARLAARIRHPNVVPTLDVVSLDGELVLVMEFVQGESLARLIRASGLRSERIPPPIVAAIMVGVLQGLHAAHEATSDQGEPLGIVHRDVSPHNVLVGIDGVARVLDFGVAKAAGRAQTTREGQLKGKLAYMAPEQVRGSVTRVTDVYAASVVLWEALTGKRLFHGDNEAQVLDRLLRGNDVPPSAHVPGLPPALDAVTMRGLDVDPARRFPTAREMARALEEVLPLASSSKIGDWVEAAAKETLDARSVRIASIESDSSMRAVADPTGGQPRLSRPGAVEAFPVTDDVLVTQASSLTQLSSGSISSPGGRPPHARSPSRTMWLAAAGAGGGLLLVVLLVLAVAHRGGDVASPTFASTASSSPVAPSSQTVSAAVSRPPASAEPVAAPAPAPAISPPPVQTAPAPVISAPPRPSPAAPAKRAPAAAACNPPWYFDGRGVRVFKPECL